MKQGKCRSPYIFGVKRPEDMNALEELEYLKKSERHKRDTIYLQRRTIGKLSNACYILIAIVLLLLLWR